MARLTPVGDRILVLPTYNKESNKGGIIVIDNSKDKPVEGLVVSVGKKRTPEGSILPFDVTPGTKVLISRFGGTDVELDGLTYVLLKEDEVLGILS
jgi:chaperonin GroES